MTTTWLQPQPPRKSIGRAALALWPLALISVLGPAVNARAAEPSRVSTPSTATLTITFRSLKSPSGALMVSLAGSSDAWADKAPPAAQAAVPVTGNTVSVTFRGLAPGAYAARAFHDLDGDGKLGVNPFGMPTEPYAFSRNARGQMGPPAWAAAAFTVTAGDNGQTIDID